MFLQRMEARLSQLAAAQEAFKKCRNEWAATVCVSLLCAFVVLSFCNFISVHLLVTFLHFFNAGVVKCGFEVVFWEQTRHDADITSQALPELVLVVSYPGCFHIVCWCCTIQETDDELKLIKYQKRLEEELRRNYINLSLHQTIYQLTLENNHKLAKQLRKEFKVPDRRYDSSLWLHSVLFDGSTLETSQGWFGGSHLFSKVEQQTFTDVNCELFWHTIVLCGSVPSGEKFMCPIRTTSHLLQNCIRWAESFSSIQLQSLVTKKWPFEIGNAKIDLWQRLANTFFWLLSGFGGWRLRRAVKPGTGWNWTDTARVRSRP